jgi:NADH:ubiquinone oxidoreductase subunit
MSLFKEIFTWWNSATWGTRLYIQRKTLFVGMDDEGNKYYKSKGLDKALGRERRMVIYKTNAEASKIPQGWWGWMHHRTDVAPSDERYEAKEWQLPHVENLTGSSNAYRPEGSVLKSGKRPKATGDYQAWQP